MSLAADLKTLYHLALAPIRGETHAERLESFYRGQAASYDDFRAHLLRGREELCRELPVPENGVWIDMGGGTGKNLAFMGERIQRLSKVYLVDLTPSLLAQARELIGARGWNHVEAVEADALTFQPAQGQADLITFSYSLTMIPDWFEAIDHAWRLLKPGGIIGVVDFFVARKYPEPGRKNQGALARAFWPCWLGLDNVWPSSEHIPYLQRRFQTLQFSEQQTRMRYLPFVPVPYYRFVGRKVGVGQAPPLELARCQNLD